MMRSRCTVPVLIFLLIPCFCPFGFGQQSARARILNVTTDKARYSPGEAVAIEVTVGGDPASLAHAVVRASFRHLEDRAGADLSKPVLISGSRPRKLTLLWMPPAADFRGYFVDVRLIGSGGGEIDRSQTAVDVSSEWNRFPRYGYLAHYSSAEEARPDAWVAELNEFHIDGLEFYDFQNRHEQPLAGTVAHPDSHWFDIAGREVERDVLNKYLAAARRHNMTAMAYNSSYSAYADAFSGASGVRMQWATWNTPNEPRTLQAAKAFNLPTNGKWKTPGLIFMNQNSPAWQNHLFEQMENLFQVYPFDGWHIDTFGTRGAYAYDGSYVDFISGFQPFVDRAKERLHKHLVLNTVGTLGQEEIARSKADFVYSELWEPNETYNSILMAADQVHSANPAAGMVFAAYLHRRDDQPAAPAGTRYFNPSSVLLADAAIFAAGAAHIELGDGMRMLSSDYFPNDTAFLVSPALHSALRNYYDFLTAYENILRCDVMPLNVTVELPGRDSSASGTPNTIWYIGRQKSDRMIVHLINLLGSNSDRWRDVNVDRPDAPLLHEIAVRVYVSRNIASAGWVTPDEDGGRFHELRFTKGSAAGRRYVDLVIPALKYWDVIVLKTASEPIQSASRPTM